MKQLAKHLPLALFLLAALPLFAVQKTGISESALPPPSGVAEAPAAKKPSFGQRIALKLVQKKIRKQQKKRARTEKAISESDPDKLATLSLIFSAGSFVLMLIPIIGALAFFTAIAGIILGFIALNKGGNKTLAILGIVFGVLFIIFVILALLLLIALFSNL
ncbi:MAG: DUF4190 domain-containing protein [Phaeodactylibacter sp.]|nr:DUF4190 domain-containing protein [Phaeodactylibacter sp.]